VVAFNFFITKRILTVIMEFLSLKPFPEEVNNFDDF